MQKIVNLNPSAETYWYRISFASDFLMDYVILVVQEVQYFVVIYVLEDNKNKSNVQKTFLFFQSMIIKSK
jgi:hypothetical protein